MQLHAVGRGRGCWPWVQDCSANCSGNLICNPMAQMKKLYLKRAIGKTKENRKTWLLCGPASRYLLRHMQELTLTDAFKDSDTTYRQPGQVLVRITIKQLFYGSRGKLSIPMGQKGTRPASKLSKTSWTVFEICLLWIGQGWVGLEFRGGVGIGVLLLV